MSKALDAADAIKRAAKQYESFITAAAILEQIGSLENALNEGRKAVTAIRAEVEEAKTELAKLKANAVNVKAEQDDLLDAAKAAASRIEENSTAQAAAIVDKAKLEGVRINQLATDSARHTEEQARAEVKRLSASRDAVYIELSRLNDQTNLANEAADSAEKRLAEVKETIAKMSAGLNG